MCVYKYIAYIMSLEIIKMDLQKVWDRSCTPTSQIGKGHGGAIQLTLYDNWQAVNFQRPYIDLRPFERLGFLLVSETHFFVISARCFRPFLIISDVCILTLHSYSEIHVAIEEIHVAIESEAV